MYVSINCISESQALVINLGNSSRYTSISGSFFRLMSGHGSENPTPSIRTKEHETAPARTVAHLYMMVDPLIDMLVFLFQVFDPSSPTSKNPSATNFQGTQRSGCLMMPPH